MLSLKKRRYLFFQCGLLALFFLSSALLVACSSGPSSTTATLAPTPTLSLQMGSIGNLSPTPTPFAYSCGAWATQSTPAYGVEHIGVNAKFTKLVNGNPQGVAGATATATVHWPSGATDKQSVQTTFDGLAVFTVNAANHSDAINKITLVTVEFDKTGVPPCTVGDSQAAFFTLVMTATPTPTPKDNKDNNNNDNNNNDNNNNHNHNNN